MLFKRADGVLLTKLPGWRKFFPYLMPTRTESFILHQQPMRMKNGLALLARLNEGRTENRYSLFHIVLAACVRLVAMRPENNRFIIGRRIFQRKEILFAFVTKKEKTEKSAETNVKVSFEREDTLEKVAERTRGNVKEMKKVKRSSDEAMTEFLTRLPRFVTRAAMWVFQTLDYFNLLPYSAIKGDALYSTAYFANVGSIGLDAITHHMFEWGNCPFFVVVGKLKKGLYVTDEGQQSIEDIITMNFTFDERCTDGVNLAKTIKLLTDCIENPEQLMTPPKDMPDPLEFA